ncbi:MAG: hypothetical protein AAF572_28955 [Cyanobacteria bacterium P01_B01_bin.77]
MALHHLIKRYTLSENPEHQQISKLENEVICCLQIPDSLTLREISQKVDSSITVVKALLEKMVKKNLVTEFQPVTQAQAA